MIRSYAARTFSARQKSVLRNLAYRVGIYTLRRVEQIVEGVVTKDGARSFLQIGANDGYYSDPLNLAIFRHQISGTLVEPQPNYFSALQKTYAKFSDLTFVPCAVSRTPGTTNLFTLDCSSGRLPGWAIGVGTLSREQILKFGDQIPNIEAYVREIEVDCITVAELLARVPNRNPDIIVVDAEGFDHAILTQFDFASLATKLVIYESESMTPADADDLAERLTGAGFCILEAGQDTVALRRDTVTFRKTVGH